MNFNRSFLSGLGLLATTSLSWGLFETEAGVFVLDLEGKAQYDSNIFASNSEESDWSLIGTGTLSYLQDRGLFSMDARAGLSHQLFFDNSDQDATNYFASAMINGSPQDGGKTTYSLGLEWKRTTDAVEEVADRVRSQRWIATVGTDWAFSDKLGIRLGGTYGQTLYSNPANLDDSDRYDLSIAGLWFYSEKLTALAGYRYRNLSFDESNRTVKTDTVFVGMEGELSPKVTGSIELGGSFGRGSQTSDNLFTSVALRWAANDRGTATLNASRDNDASALAANAIGTTITAGYTHRIDQRLSLGGALTYGEFERDGSTPQKDDFWRASLNLAAQLGQNGRAGANLSYEDRNSDRDISNFTRLIFGVTAGYVF